MRFTRKSCFSYAACAALVLLAAGAEASTVWHVPGDRSTINAAIQAAASGDTILVGPGNYRERLSWFYKDLTIQGAGAATTIIDPSVANGGPGGPCMYAGGLTSASRLDGFTLRRGSNSDFNSSGGGAIHAEDVSLCISNCVFTDNVSGMFGGAISSQGGDLTVTGCGFRNNTAFSDGGAIMCDLCSLTAVNCIFSHNSTGGSGSAILIGGASLQLIGSNLSNNDGAVLDILASDATITNCTICYPASSGGSSTAIVLEPGFDGVNAHTTTINSSILWGHSQGAILNDSNRLNIYYTDLQGRANAQPDANGNLGADPGFLNGPGGDQRLLPGSPCRDRGATWLVQSPPFLSSNGVIVDLSGNPRVVYGAVDLGAIEYSDYAPVAWGEKYTTSEDTPLSISSPGLLANDTDLEGSPLTAKKVAGPSHGQLALNVDGSFTYTPDANYNGSDSFTYMANDGTLDSNEATVTIDVTPVNDAPVAADDAYSTSEDSSLIVAAGGVLMNDSDVDGDTITAVLNTGPTHGSLTLSVDGSFVYTPDANFNGVDRFTYHANDGSADGNVATVTITVLPANDPPMAADDAYSMDQGATLSVAGPGVLANDTDIDNDPLSASLVSGPANGTVTLNADGSFTYKPNASFYGTDSFTYQASDGKATSTATVTITVKQVAKGYSAQIAAIRDLKVKVMAMVSRHKHHHGCGESLCEKLERTIRALERNDPATARRKLWHFIDELRMYVRTQRLSKSECQPLIDAASAIIGQL